MGEVNISHWFVVLAIFIVPPYLLYRHGRRAGDQEGYIRGYKDGQESAKASR